MKKNEKIKKKLIIISLLTWLFIHLEISAADKDKDKDLPVKPISTPQKITPNNPEKANTSKPINKISGNKAKPNKKNIAIPQEILDEDVEVGSRGDKVGKSPFEGLELFSKVLHIVETQYYRPVEREKLIQGALRGMMSTLDPHSAFLDKELFTKIEEDTKGEFGGLGIEVTQKEGILMVVTPIEDSPAFRAGVKSYDQIVEINGESTIGLSLEESVNKMRGGAGSSIVLGVSRKGTEGILRFTLKREIIKIKSVKSEILDNEILYLKLTQFQKNSTQLLEDAIRNESKKIASGPRGIILDLRFNPGGLLDEAVSVSSVFLRDGIVVSTEYRDTKSKETKYVLKSGLKDITTPLVVLINGSSASASEIVAGALQDHKRGIIMGSTSFGKGSVQTISRLDDQKGMKLTVAQYLTPNGRKIQTIGIIPDIPLDQIDGVWSDYVSESSMIREKDLRNHLTATIESEEEKKVRIDEEKKYRTKLQEKIKRKKKNPKNPAGTTGGDEIQAENLRDNSPKDDYQVIQAANYLKGISMLKKIKSL